MDEARRRLQEFYTPAKALGCVVVSRKFGLLLKGRLWLTNPRNKYIGARPQNFLWTLRQNLAYRNSYQIN